MQSTPPPLEPQFQQPSITPTRTIVNPLPPAVVHSGFWEQASRASWIAPLIGMVFSFLASSARHPGRGASTIVAYTYMGFIAIGFILAIAAMYGALVKKVRGILGGVVAGFCINSALVVIVVAIISSAKHVSASREVAPMPELRQPEFDIDPLKINQPAQAPKNYAWQRKAMAKSAVITVTRWNDNAGEIHELKSELNAECTILAISIDNSAGDASVTIDPDSVLLKLSDGQLVKCIPTWRIFGSAKHNSQEWSRKYACLQLVPAHGQLKVAYAFVPADIDFAKVSSARVDVDGQGTEVSGRP